MRHQWRDRLSKKRQATIPHRGTAVRRVCSVNRYSAMVTNLDLPPK